MNQPTGGPLRSPEDVERLHAAGHWRSDYLTDLPDTRAGTDPDRVLVYDRDVRLTWGAARERSLGLAHALRELGLARGDRMAVQLPNWHEFVVTYLALARLGP